MSLIFEEEVVDEVEEEPVPVRRSNPAKPAVKPEAKPAVPLPQAVKAVYLDTRKEKEKEKERKDRILSEAGNCITCLIICDRICQTIKKKRKETS